MARLQALLEASRQVHSTIREEEVLDQALRIVVREHEMAGAAFPGQALAYGDAVAQPTAARPRSSPIRSPIATATNDRLVVASPGGRELTLSEADFLRPGSAGRRGS